jgi:hypothetical protein
MKKLLALALGLALLPTAGFAQTKPGGSLGIAVDPNGNLAFLHVDASGNVLLGGSGPGLGMIVPGGQTGVALDPSGKYAFLHVDSSGGLLISGGSSFGTMASQNANAVAITGGTTANVTGTNNTENNLTAYGPNVFGAITLGNGSAGNGAYFVSTPYAMPALAIPVTQRYSTVTLTDSDTGHPNEALTFSGTPVAGQEWTVDVKNGGSVVHGPTVPSSWDYNLGATSTTFNIQPNSFVRLSWISPDGIAYHMSGAPRTLHDLGAVTPVAADEVMFYQVGQTGAGVVNKATLSALPYPHQVSIVINGNGAAIPANTTLAAYTLASANFTITKWKMTAYPLGSSITLDAFRISWASSSSGTVLPTATIVGSGTKPSIASAVASYGTPSDWVAGGGSVTVTENDNFTVATVGTPTATYATLTLYGQ